MKMRMTRIRIAAGLIATASGVSLQMSEVVVRNRDGSVACVIAPADPSRGLMTVHVRGPANPDPTLVPRLPADRRDFSALPMRVVLLATTSDGTPHERRASKIEALLEYPVINGQPSPVPFVRVSFPRAWLVAGTTILGERTVSLSARDRVTSQTTCRITVADADQWR